MRHDRFTPTAACCSFAARLGTGRRVNTDPVCRQVRRAGGEKRIKIAASDSHGGLLLGSWLSASPISPAGAALF
jgi:hypothetical protein